MTLPPTKARRDQLKLVPLIVDERAGSVLPAASSEAPGCRVPAAMAEAMSVRSDEASATAPLTFSMPAPCCSRLAPTMGCAVYCRIALISGGVRPGLACSISATVPATTGAEIEVPLSSISVSRKVCVRPSGATRSA